MKTSKKFNMLHQSQKRRIVEADQRVKTLATNPKTSTEEKLTTRKNKNLLPPPKNRRKLQEDSLAVYSPGEMEHRRVPQVLRKRAREVNLLARNPQGKRARSERVIRRRKKSNYF